MLRFLGIGDDILSKFFVYFKCYFLQSVKFTFGLIVNPLIPDPKIVCSTFTPLKFTHPSGFTAIIFRL